MHVEKSTYFKKRTEVTCRYFIWAFSCVSVNMIVPAHMLVTLLAQTSERSQRIDMKFVGPPIAPVGARQADIVIVLHIFVVIFEFFCVVASEFSMLSH